MSLHDSIALMVRGMPHFSSSPSVSWLCVDSQSVMNSCSPCFFYSIIVLYWCIYSSILWSLYDRHAVLFINIATSSLWYVITFNSQPKQWWWNFSTQCCMPSAFLSMWLLWVSCTCQAFACECYWPQHCVVRCWISWEPHSIPRFQKTCS